MKPLLFALLFAAGPALAESPAWLKSDAPAAKSARPSKSMQLKLDLRELWAENALWTRAYVVSALAGVEDEEPIRNRLMRHQEDIGAALQPYYGKQSGDRLATLLKDRVNIATDVVQAAKGGNKDARTTAQKRLSANADEIAEFLADANPNWSEGDLQPMLQKEAEHLTKVVDARVKANWDDDIDAAEGGIESSMKFADSLADGIVRQFPEKFTAGA